MRSPCRRGRVAGGRCKRAFAHVTVCGVHWATGPSALAVLLVGAGCCTCTGTTARRRRHPSDTTLSGSRASSARRRANVARVAHPRRYRGNTAAFRRIDSYWHRSIRPQRTAACTACQAYVCTRTAVRPSNSAFRMQRTTRALHAWTALAGTLGTPRAALGTPRAALGTPRALSSTHDKPACAHAVWCVHFVCRIYVCFVCLSRAPVILRFGRPMTPLRDWARTGCRRT